MVEHTANKYFIKYYDKIYYLLFDKWNCIGYYFAVDETFNLFSFKNIETKWFFNFTKVKRLIINTIRNGNR